jgi:hypothetical protein
MNWVRSICVVVCSSLIVGCSQPGITAGAPESAKVESVVQDAAPAALTESLFKADQAILTNQEIDRIFAERIYPPAHGRVAVIRIGGRYPTRWGWWSEQTAQLEQQITAELLATIRSSPRVTDAFVLPTLLQPPTATIPYLREAAARVQADSLLIYRTFTQNFQKQRVFGNDEVHAYCTAEAVLLDTRSGIVTFTSISTEPFSAQKSPKEVNFEETVALAEQQAQSKALKRIGDELLKYLKDAPMPKSSATNP